jgi:hypothetical protein
MAHIGRDYKLQFRRDLAQVRNNQDAYPEAFRFTQDVGFGAVFQDNRNHIVPLVNTSTVDQPPMIWISQPRPVGGRDYRMRLTINDPFHIGQDSVIFEVFYIAPITMLYKFICPAGAWNGVPDHLNGHPGVVVIDDPLWGSGGPDDVWQTFALGWRDYNP